MGAYHDHGEWYTINEHTLKHYFTMAELSTNPKTVASRERVDFWSDSEKALYKKKLNALTAISKRIKGLKEPEVYKSAIPGFQKEMEENLKG